MIQFCPSYYMEPSRHKVPDKKGRTKCDDCHLPVRADNSVHMWHNERNWVLLCMDCVAPYGLEAVVGA